MYTPIFSDGIYLTLFISNCCCYQFASAGSGSEKKTLPPRCPSRVSFTVALDKPFGWRIKTQPALSVCFQNMLGNMIEKQNDAE